MSTDYNNTRLFTFGRKLYNQVECDANCVTKDAISPVLLVINLYVRNHLENTLNRKDAIEVKLIHTFSLTYDQNLIHASSSYNDNFR